MLQKKTGKFLKNLLFTALISLMPCFDISDFSCRAEQMYYDFSDEAQAQFDMQNNPASQITNIINIVNTNYLPENYTNYTPEQNSMQNTSLQDPNQTPNTTLNGSLVYVPAGSSFQAVLQSSISSQSLTQNDTIAAVIDNDWYQNNVLIAPKGSIVYGKAVNTKKAGRAYANGSLSIKFNEILTPKGEYINLVTNTVVISIEAKNRPLKITADVARGTLGGFILSTSTYVMAASAAAGAIDGIFNALTNRGEEVEIPAGTAITVRLIQPMNIAPYI